MSIVVTRFSKIAGSGALMGFLSITFPIPGCPNFFVNDMKLFQSNGKRYVKFPDKPYEKDGETKYFPQCGFVERFDEFSDMVVKALDEYCMKNAQQQSLSLQNVPASTKRFEPKEDECPF